MNSDNQNTNSKNTGLYNSIENIKLWFLLLLKRWWIITLVGLIGGVAGYLLAYFERPKYQSRLTFSIDDGGGELSGTMGLAAELGFNIGTSNSIFGGDNILTILTSSRIIKSVLLSTDTLNGKALTMASYYLLISADTTKKKAAVKQLSPAEIRLSKVTFPVGQPRSTFSYLQDSVLMNIYKGFATGGGLKVSKPDKKMNLYEVSVTSFDERFSKVFTDKIINEAIIFYTEIRTKKSKETLDVLESRVAQTRGSLNSAIISRASIQDANVNPVFQQAQAQLQTKQVDISAYSGAYGELYKNLEMARFQYLKDIPLLQIIDAADYPMNRIKKGKLRTAIIFASISGFIIVLILTIIHIISLELSRINKIGVKQGLAVSN